MSYIDGFVIPVPTDKEAAFVAHAGLIDTIFKELGALRVIECWGDDVPDGKVTDFRRAVNAEPDETIVFAWIEWPDKDTRDAAMQSFQDMMETDPRFKQAESAVPFDGKRMIYGGFRTVYEI